MFAPSSESFSHLLSSLCLAQFYWVNVNAGYDGDIYLTIVLNGFIHTVMYTYYFVSMHTKDIWWKKYLTLMQVRLPPLVVSIASVYVVCIRSRVRERAHKLLILLGAVVVLTSEYYVQARVYARR